MCGRCPLRLSGGGFPYSWFPQLVLCKLWRMTFVIGESVSRRREVLRVLRASPDPMSIVAIAEVLGVHPNTVRFHLDSLVGDGQVEHVEPDRKGPGRPPLMF